MDSRYEPGEGNRFRASKPLGRAKFLMSIVNEKARAWTAKI